MIPARVLADALEAAGIGVVGKTIFIGRIPAEKMTIEGLWSVAAVSPPFSTTHWKTTMQMQISVLFSSEDVDKMYELDPVIRRALMKIPLENEFIPRVTVAPLQDNDLIEGELRAGVWMVEVVVINSK